MVRLILLVGLIILCPQKLPSQETPKTQSGPCIEVRLGPDLIKVPFTGRVYVFLSQREGIEPRKLLRFLNAEPILAKDVSNLLPNQTVVFSLDDAEVLRFPRDLKTANLNGQHAQAIVRLNRFDPEINIAEGNGFSGVATIDTTEAMTVRLTVDQIIPPYEFKRTARRREFTVRSERLSEFYGFDVALSAAVIVPESYDSTATRFPVVFHLPSFGGSHHHAEPQSTQNDCGVEFLHVMLDARCPTGHHVFADSENNGPYQTAFVGEFLPAFEQAYRTVGERHGRFLTGHSSGAWSGLWLLLNHPDTFAGVWSFSPDPVDFSDFQRIDLYSAGANMFFDANGNRRPLNLQEDGRVLIWFEELSDLEHVLGRGGQLGSFEAVFSPKGDDGRPVFLWDRDTGAINPQVAAHWKAYDIHRALTAKWPQLSRELQGRIHIHVDENDVYFLDGAIKRLASSFSNRPGHLEDCIHPGWGHGSYLTDEFAQAVNTAMAEQFLRESSEPVVGRSQSQRSISGADDCRR